MFFEYLKYRIKSGNAHSIHSPFVFEFYNNVFKSDLEDSCFEKIENQRNALANSTEEIHFIDLGAGSKKYKKATRKISQIANSSLKSKKWSRLLFRICRYYGCQNILELGTSLGVTTLYLASSKPESRVVTLEGSPEVAQIAKGIFDTLALKNIEIVIGNIDDTLEIALKKMGTPDLVFFDANHTYQATLSYFEKSLAYVSNSTCFVFDDIYWSKGMKKAWSEIQNHPQVRVSIDLFFIGIVFFRKESPKQQFILR
ncbi:MAG: class I SAM-dependent methyltransferase [Bacteroidetes bacterium]|nr:class I SAM-dependent methyltransferase [Bacteroidota bacterium]